MNKQELKWRQRLKSFSIALSQLESAAKTANNKSFSALEKLGTIHVFEFTHELAWNVLKDYFESQGNRSITGSRDASNEASKKGIIINIDIWMDVILSRNKTSHTYNNMVADEIFEKILKQYFPEFMSFELKMKSLAGNHNA